MPQQPPAWVQDRQRAAAELATEARHAATPAVGWMLAGGAIVASLVMTLLSHHFRPDAHRTVHTYLEIAVALPLIVYALVATAAVLVVRSGDLRLRWTRGAPIPGALLGLVVGAVCGTVLLAQTSLVTGHVVVDPGITIQLSEDTWWATVTGMLVLVVIAPVVEEIVFRGVLAQSMMARGAAVAIFSSAPAFWLWHWRLSVPAFVVLGGMGAVLATVYRFRGLVASMTAHATYNGILVAVVIAQLSGPAHTYSTQGLSLSAPRSWRTVSANDFVLTGPSGAFVEIASRSLDRSPTQDDLVSGLETASRELATQGLSLGPVTPVSLPLGDGAQIVATRGAHHVTITDVAVGQVGYVLEVDDEGSATAARQAAEILQSIQAS